MKLIGLVSVVVIFLDRVIKMLVDNFLVLNIKNTVIDNFLYLTKCYNEGAAFSILSGNTIFLILVTLLALFMLFRHIKRNDNFSVLNRVSYGLLIGGIVGNLIDRLFLGYVVDYINFIVFKHEFAIFNLADIAIVVGAILILLCDWGDKDGGKNKN